MTLTDKEIKDVFRGNAEYQGEKNGKKIDFMTWQNFKDAVKVIKQVDEIRNGKSK